MSEQGKAPATARPDAPIRTAFWASRRAIVLAGALIVLSALAAYQNTFSVPFIFDDAAAITDNPTIRQLWPIWPALSPPHAGEPTTGRPVVNLSLAVNYALGGNAVGGYHAFNLAIHILAGLTLFGIVRRTLLQPALRERFGAASLPLALAVALLWTVHPLQTGAVTYVAQRAESLMGLFYLLTLYAFIRAAAFSSSMAWHALAVAACLLGMGSKEVMVSAPLIVLLYDRTFVAGSFRGAWKLRRRLYLSLAATWLLLGYLVAHTGARGGTAGFGTEVAWPAYALTQCRAITHYLWLSVWPHPLVFDYGKSVLVKGAAAAVPGALLLVLLAAGTVMGLRRWPALGFLGCWFFAILAPSSSVVPVATELMAEHRMYLPLAAVVTVAVLCIHAWTGRRSALIFLALAVALTVLTARRNADYRSALALWSDTVAKREDNARAHDNLGLALLDLGRTNEAIAQFESALAIQPDNPTTHNNLGNVLLHQGQVDPAITQLRRALELQPHFTLAHFNFANALLQKGQAEAAIEHFQKALELRPGFAEAHINLANLLLRLGRTDEAIAHLQQAAALAPDSEEARNDLGNALLQKGQVNEAMDQYRKALEIRPGNAMVHYNFGYVLLQTGQVDEAITHFRKALELQPGFAEAHNSLGYALLQQGRAQEAMTHFQDALAIQPRNVEAGNNLAWLLATSPQAAIRDGARAVELAQQANQSSGGKDPLILRTLAAAYAEAGRFPEAIGTARQALQLAGAQTGATLVSGLRTQLELYQSGSPFHEQGLTNAPAAPARP